MFVSETQNVLSLDVNPNAEVGERFMAPKFDPCKRMLIDADAAEFETVAILTDAPSMDIEDDNVAIKLPAVIENLLLPPIIWLNLACNRVSDSHNVISLAVSLITSLIVLSIAPIL